MDNNNNKLQSSYVYIILGLLAAAFIGAVYIAVRCYTPYSFRSSVSAELKPVLWSFMLLPSVILPIALWLANMLKPTLSRFSLLSVLLTCCFFAAVPRLYSFGDVSDMSYITSTFTFFLVCCTISVIVRDIKKKRIIAIVNMIFGILLTLSFILLSLYMSYFVLNIDFMDRIIICVILPVVCALVALGSIFDIYSTATLILNILCAGYGTLCAAFPQLNIKAVYIILTGLCALAAIWQIIDIIKYIFSKER